jgi:hypothetical protein
MRSDTPQTMRNVVFLVYYLLIEVNIIEMHPSPSAIDVDLLQLWQPSLELLEVLLEFF